MIVVNHNKRKAQNTNWQTEQKVESFILNDRTDNMWNSYKSANDIFSEFNELVINCRERFGRDVFVLCKRGATLTKSAC